MLNTTRSDLESAKGRQVGADFLIFKFIGAIRFQLNGIENDLLVLQLRIYDRKRLIRKIGIISKDDFTRIIGAIKGLL